MTSPKLAASLIPPSKNVLSLVLYGFNTYNYTLLDIQTSELGIIVNSQLCTLNDRTIWAISSINFPTLLTSLPRLSITTQLRDMGLWF